ncbi:MULTISPECIES: ComEA family DNA-binding protein [Methylococcus]|uniref:ComEA family DNA-binding protein n=1 Tax=Methylococcus capsulatus TaxID=414 RepID=A0ABZ2F0M7_METCP|nr:MULTISPECIES: ComEA family DNA-binding protein [Methylococcus]MDF9391497.1 ComEA family DNA-binding protein [Methylococcus capsulatus]
MKKLCALLLFMFFSLAAWAEPLDINTATAEEIAATMTGVGKAKAEAIVKDREAHGNFKSVDDLKRVKGIKEGILAKNRDKITVKGEAVASPVPAVASPAAATAAPTAATSAGKPQH